MDVKPIDCPHYNRLSDCPDDDDPVGDRGNSTESATQAVFHEHISKSALKKERDNLDKKLDEYIYDTILAFSDTLEEIKKPEDFEKVLEEFTIRFQTQATADLSGMIKSTLCEENLYKFDVESSIHTIIESFPTLFKEFLLKDRKIYLSSKEFLLIKEVLELIIDKTTTDLNQRLTLKQKFQKAIEEYSSSFSIFNHHQFTNIINRIVL